MTRPNRRGLVAVEAALFGLSALAFASQAAPRLAMVNETRSLPRGLYLRAPRASLGRGAVVALAPPPEAAAYLRGLGMPERSRLLKRVAAVGGDPVCARAGRVSAAGRAAPVRDHDRRGVALPAWRGCGPLAPDQLFLLGDSPDSFDSRYFGPVDKGAIEGVFRESVTW